MYLVLTCKHNCISHKQKLNITKVVHVKVHITSKGYDIEVI